MKTKGFLTIIVEQNDAPARCFAGEVHSYAEFEQFIMETTDNRRKMFKAYFQTGRNKSELVETN